MRSSPLGAPSVSWRYLEELVRLQSPALSSPPPGEPGLCVVCRGPCAPRNGRCFQCHLHNQCAHDSMADVVVPIAYAIKGDEHAQRLWQYKSPVVPEAADAAAKLLALLLVFLRDHGECVWTAARMPAGPTHVAVVPTGRARTGPHPLRTLLTPYIAGPWADLSARTGNQQFRDLDPARFAAPRIPGALVLLIDDTWTTGASAQSAAMALRRAGARRIATVVLGRHVGRADTVTAPYGPEAMPFLAESCSVHETDPQDATTAPRPP